MHTFHPLGTSLGIGRALGRGFSIWSKHLPRRVFVYVDGFNLYHAIDDLGDNSLKWLNLWNLAESIIGDGETLYSVKYFTAYATWHASGYARHREYVAALKEEGVTVYLGNFKEKFKDCPKCKASIKSHEEKETDVNIGIHLVADALQDRFDRAIIISADSDLCCAVNLAKELAPAKAIDVASPPGRHAHARELKPLFSVTKGKIRAARLEEIYTNQAGAVIAQTPDKYRV